ncbi:MAG TPA: FecR domain-containing protein [Polyangiaceae bacterium]|nr:FecR domain-containing protein [Polyangiaceae bacterium]
MNPPPHRYVQPEVNEARVERLWQNVSRRLDVRPSHALRWVLLTAAVSGAAAGSLFWQKSRPSSVPVAGAGEHALLADAKLETKSDELSVTLNDGSSLKLRAQSEVQVHSSQSSSIALQLTRGELWCDVTHRDERKFKVVAGDVEVRVVGTQFSVKTLAGASPRVEVSVTRGVVEVSSARRPGVVARVGAGQSWIQDAASAPHASESAPTAEPGSGDATQPDATQPDATQPDAKAASASAAPSAMTAGIPSARDLFERAAESRRAGDPAAAAHAYEELLRLHPGDARASLSAFELGRLRMDRLGDLGGAITALERAVATNIGPSFREDALARLVSVYASKGNVAACQRARDRYLSSYPTGVHATTVASRCAAH